MQLFVNLGTDLLTLEKGSDKAIARIDVRRFSKRPLEIQFIENLNAALIDSAAVVSWDVKAAGDYLGESVVSAELSAPGASTGFYSGSVEYDNAALDALFLNGSEQRSSVTLIGELTWTIEGEQIGKSQVVSVVISNALSSEPVVSVFTHSLNFSDSRNSGLLATI